MLCPKPRNAGTNCL